MFVEWNPSPVGRRVGDCAVRAVSKAIDGRSAAEIWPIMDELMSVLQATNTRLYNGVMRKIEE